MPLAQGSEMLVAAGSGLAVKAAGSGMIFLVVETAGAGLAMNAAGLAHWRDRGHWLNRPEGWMPRKEIWDGKRFAELSWF